MVNLEMTSAPAVLGCMHTPGGKVGLGFRDVSKRRGLVTGAGIVGVWVWRHGRASSWARGKEDLPTSLRSGAVGRLAWWGHYPPLTRTHRQPWLRQSCSPAHPQVDVLQVDYFTLPNCTFFRVPTSPWNVSPVVFSLKIPGPGKSLWSWKLPENILESCAFF